MREIRVPSQSLLGFDDFNIRKSALMEIQLGDGRELPIQTSDVEGRKRALTYVIKPDIPAPTIAIS